MIKKVFAGVALLLVVAAGYFYDDVQRLRLLDQLFSADNIVHNFRHMDQLFDTVEVKRAGDISPLPAAPVALPESFSWQGNEVGLNEFLSRTGTTGFLVMHNNEVVSENYYLGETADDLHIAWSVTKSFVSALVGIAVDEGRIDSIDDAIDQYVPALAPSGFHDVSIRDILNMASGIAFNEDYSDSNSDVNRMGYTLFNGGSLDKVAASLQSERPAGEYNHYVSANTHVLGMLLEAVYPQSLAQLLQDKLWAKMGMQSDALFIVDGEGAAMAIGGLNATLRDYARFGQLYLQLGRWQGEQLVPRQWILDSIVTDAPHLKPGLSDFSDTPFGYGYQWWIPEQPDGDYTAVGIYNQFIYIDPKSNVVIVKTSANPRYLEEWGELETVTMFQQISAQVAASRQSFAQTR